jgi:hypothetical protein
LLREFEERVGGYASHPPGYRRAVAVHTDSAR